MKNTDNESQNTGQAGFGKSASPLTLDNYRHGFLVDEESIAGVTELAGGLYCAYASHYLTGETLFYQEFATPEEALAQISEMPRNWIYESLGCKSKTKVSSAGDAKESGCGTGSCPSCATGCSS